MFDLYLPTRQVFVVEVAELGTVDIQARKALVSFAGVLGDILPLHPSDSDFSP